MYIYHSNRRKFFNRRENSQESFFTFFLFFSPTAQGGKEEEWRPVIKLWKIFHWIITLFLSITSLCLRTTSSHKIFHVPHCCFPDNFLHRFLDNEKSRFIVFVWKEWKIYTNRLYLSFVVHVQPILILPLILLY